MQTKLYKQMALTLTLFASSFFILSSSAQAAMISFTSDLVGPISSRTASVQKFDTSLGSLNFVRISYDLTSKLSVYYENNSFDIATATIGDNLLQILGHNPTSRFSSTENQFLAATEISGDFQVAAARSFAGITLPGRRTVEFETTARRSFDSRGIRIGSITINNFNKNIYSGSGNFNFNFSSSTQSPLLFSGLQPSLIFTQLPSLGGNVTVSYDFTEAVVPIPASLPLFAAGLAWLGARSYRKKSSLI